MRMGGCVIGVRNKMREREIKQRMKRDWNPIEAARTFTFKHVGCLFRTHAEPSESAISSTATTTALLQLLCFRTRDS